jgi:hypothetical protein
LRRFVTVTPDSFVADMDRRRPPVSDAAMRARVIAALPRAGELTLLTSSQERKLDTVGEVLRPHRRDGVYLLKVVDSARARLGLHARFVVLISKRALDLLSAKQLSAAVAHEIAHEYEWDAYEHATNRRDWGRIREIELFCDGFAVVTLSRIGADITDYATALKLLYEVRGADRSTNDTFYPSPGERQKFINEIAKWLSSSKR